MVKRNSSRLGGNRPRTHPSSSRKNRSIATEQTRETSQQLKLVVFHLKHARAVVVTAMAALWHQSADHDVDVAVALQHAVAHPLLTEIERLEKLIGREVGHG